MNLSTKIQFAKELAAYPEAEREEVLILAKEFEAQYGGAEEESKPRKQGRKKPVQRRRKKAAEPTPEPEPSPEPAATPAPRRQRKVKEEPAPTPEPPKTRRRRAEPEDAAPDTEDDAADQGERSQEQDDVDAALRDLNLDD